MSNTGRDNAIQDYRDRGECFDYEAHSEADFGELLKWLNSCGYVVLEREAATAAMGLLVNYKWSRDVDMATGFDISRVVADLNAAINKTAAPTAKDGQGDDTTQERGYHD